VLRADRATATLRRASYGWASYGRRVRDRRGSDGTVCAGAVLGFSRGRDHLEGYGSPEASTPNRRTAENDHGQIYQPGSPCVKCTLGVMTPSGNRVGGHVAR